MDFDSAQETAAVSMFQDHIALIEDSLHPAASVKYHIMNKTMQGGSEIRGHGL